LLDQRFERRRLRRQREEAMENIKEAIALCLEVRAERGMPLTFETSDVEVAV
jgi:predicted RNase H-like HicB family nuclease